VPKKKSALGKSTSKMDNRTLNSIPGDEESSMLSPTMNVSRQSLVKKSPAKVKALKKSVQFSNDPGVENPLAPGTIIPVPASLISDDSHSDGDLDIDIIKSAHDSDRAFTPVGGPDGLDPEPLQESRKSITDILGLGGIETLEDKLT
jgi:hypothetical protein